MKKQVQHHDQPNNDTKTHTKSEQLQQLILDNAHDLIAIHKLADLSYAYVNPATLNGLGYCKEELVGRSATEFIHPEDLDRVLVTIAENLSIGAGNTEFRYRKKDGTYIWLEVTAKLIPDGKEDAIVVISRDITDRKQVEAMLQNARAELELKVQARTAQLSQLNEQLQTKLSEQRQAELQLKASEARFRSLFEKAPVAIALNRNGRTLFVNQAYVSMFRYEESAQLIGTPVLNQVAPGCRRAIGNKIKKREKGEAIPLSHETLGLRQDGSTFPLFVQVDNILMPDGPANVAFFTDNTDRKKAEEGRQRQLESQALLLEISKQFTSIVAEDMDNLIDSTLQRIGVFDASDRSYVFLFSEDGITMSNTHEWCAPGISSEKANSQGLKVDSLPWWRDKIRSLETIYIPRVADLPPEAKAEKDIFQAQAIQSMLVVPIISVDKIIGFLGFDSVRKEKVWTAENKTILELVAQILANALQRKKSILALKESESFYRTIFENTGAATMVIEADMTISQANREWERLFGYPTEKLVGSKWTDYFNGALAEQMKGYHFLRRIDAAAAPLQYATRLRDKQGKRREGLLYADIIPGTSKSVATFMDLTDFNRINRALRATSAGNIAMIQASDEQELLQNVCQKIVDIGGYHMAWVGYIENDERQTVRPVCYAGHEADYLQTVDISLSDPQRGNGPAGIAIRTGHPFVCRDVMNDPNFAPWQEEALSRGYKSIITLPLQANGGGPFGVLCIYSSEIDIFDAEEEKLLAEMAADLAYGIMSLRARSERNFSAQELEKSLEKMRRILNQTVTSLAMVLEIRDPYTAGHQRKVTQLAIAVAKEMDLSEDDIEGLYVAANLHDIGKINIPNEILSKPGRITEMEFGIIKTHSQSAYDIIKEIEFPWPVAEIVLQHHERMNGSGYPQGLAGEQILLSARILAVADVLEAMASHRPYRPALGLDMALEEIDRNKGILYDPDVAEACLKLFREKGYKLE